MTGKPESPSIFQHHLVPRGTRLAGWAFLVKEFGLEAPLMAPSTIAEGHIKGSRRSENGWTVFDRRYWPGDKLTDHLTFALRHETIDLLILKRLFAAITPDEIAGFIREAPTGAVTRRTWFFYERLTGITLDIEEAPAVTAVEALDPKVYYVGKPRLSRRHRVRDNLLGTGAYCPIIRRTRALEEFRSAGLATRVSEIVGRTGTRLISRAASFLLLADSRASFEIAGERPPRTRIERWGRAISQAGRYPLSVEELNRLLGILFEDMRFIRAGLRPDGVFIGERNVDGEPLPEFIGARADNLADLLTGMLDANQRMHDSDLDPVLQAAATAFGFVYIHPYQDGNGRLHRIIIHHILAERGFTPEGIVFPVSSVMLDRINEYHEVLRRHSAALMRFIAWRPAAGGNIEVLNETADLYRYFDGTREAEFLYACVARAIEHDLPAEIDFLQRQDEGQRRIMETVEMPDRLALDLIVFMRQNNGRLPEKRRRSVFKALTDDEVARIESIYAKVFGAGRTTM